ncbi:uncharacterized protein BJX67DRAFT_384203 [Aspergillus lucknowensis]|uniref:Uncharacterized protein n=1 Tax=Aspergillus lucknowensis TaxID=176173 RepID=A0ABR4LHL0_9EURO
MAADPSLAASGILQGGIYIITDDLPRMFVYGRPANQGVSWYIPENSCAIALCSVRAAIFVPVAPHPQMRSGASKQVTSIRRSIVHAMESIKPFIRSRKNEYFPNTEQLSVSIVFRHRSHAHERSLRYVQSFFAGIGIRKPIQWLRIPQAAPTPKKDQIKDQISVIICDGEGALPLVRIMGSVAWLRVYGVELTSIGWPVAGMLARTPSSAYVVRNTGESIFPIARVLLPRVSPTSSDRGAAQSSSISMETASQNSASNSSPPALPDGTTPSESDSTALSCKGKKGLRDIADAN